MCVWQLITVMSRYCECLCGGGGNGVHSAAQSRLQPARPFFTRASLEEEREAVNVTMKSTFSD